MVREYPAVTITSSTPAPAESGAYRKTSFAIEPIQLPIVPLSLFKLAELRIPTACKHAALHGPVPHGGRWHDS